MKPKNKTICVTLVFMQKKNLKQTGEIFLNAHSQYTKYEQVRYTIRYLQKVKRRPHSTHCEDEIHKRRAELGDREESSTWTEQRRRWGKSIEIQYYWYYLSKVFAQSLAEEWTFFSKSLIRSFFFLVPNAQKTVFHRYGTDFLFSAVVVFVAKSSVFLEFWHRLIKLHDDRCQFVKSLFS